jgi:hypothetical protein
LNAQAPSWTAADFGLHLVCGAEPKNRVDLPPAVTFILFGVQVVRLGGARRKAVVAHHLAVHARRDALCATMLILDKRQQRQTLERRAPLAAAHDHLNGRQSAWRWIGLVGLLT